jgi:hypothetical protein
MRGKLHALIGFAIERSSLEVQPADTNRIAGNAHRKSREIRSWKRETKEASRLFLRTKIASKRI